jgi:hypothetical protein
MKGGANNEDEAEKLTLGQLNTLIAAAEWRYKDDSRNSALRKSAFKKLVWLETQRERCTAFLHPEGRAHSRNPN